MSICFICKNLRKSGVARVSRSRSLCLFPLLPSLPRVFSFFLSLHARTHARTLVHSLLLKILFFSVCMALPAMFDRCISLISVLSLLSYLFPSLFSRRFILFSFSRTVGVPLVHYAVFPPPSIRVYVLPPFCVTLPLLSLFLPPLVPRRCRSSSRERMYVCARANACTIAKFDCAMC